MDQRTTEAQIAGGLTAATLCFEATAVFVNIAFLSPKQTEVSGRGFQSSSRGILSILDNALVL